VGGELHFGVSVGWLWGWWSCEGRLSNDEKWVLDVILKVIGGDDVDVLAVDVEYIWSCECSLRGLKLLWDWWEMVGNRLLLLVSRREEWRRRICLDLQRRHLYPLQRALTLIHTFDLAYSVYLLKISGKVTIWPSGSWKLLAQSFMSKSCPGSRKWKEVCDQRLAFYMASNPIWIASWPFLQCGASLSLHEGLWNAHFHP
jgi:hypothetical protein